MESPFAHRRQGMIDNQQPYRERQLHLTTRFYGDRAFVLSRHGARRNVGSQPKFYRFRSSHCSDCLFGQLIRNLYRSMRAVFIANKSLFISQHIGWKKQYGCRRTAGHRFRTSSHHIVLIPSKAQSAYVRAHSAIRCLSIP